MLAERKEYSLDTIIDTVKQLGKGLGIGTDKICYLESIGLIYRCIAMQIHDAENIGSEKYYWYIEHILETCAEDGCELWEWLIHNKVCGSIFKIECLYGYSISNKNLGKILNTIYKIGFNNLPVEIIGSIYEYLQNYGFRYINREWVLEKKETTRRENGAHYTSINTSNKILEDSLSKVLDKCSSREDVLALNILDPSNGSGNLLIAIIRRINERFPNIEKIDIIKHCIYGIDNDRLAMDICKLCLWLEVRKDIKLIDMIRITDGRMIVHDFLLLDRAQEA